MSWIIKKRRVTYFGHTHWTILCKAAMNAHTYAQEILGVRYSWTNLNAENAARFEDKLEARLVFKHLKKQKDFEYKIDVW